MLRVFEGSLVRRGIGAWLVAAIIVALSLLFGERYLDRSVFRIDLLRLLFTLPLGIIAGGLAAQLLDRWTGSRLGSIAAWIVFFALLGVGFVLSIDPPSQILTRTTTASLALWSVIMGTALGLALFSPDDRTAGEHRGRPTIRRDGHDRDRAT